MAFSDYIRVDVALTTEPYAGTPSWTDITSQVRSWSCDYRAGAPTTLTVEVNNNDGRWDPASTYVSAPYSGNVKRDRLIRLTASDDAWVSETVLAVCLLDDVRPVSRRLAGTTTLVATDWLRVLQEYELEDWARDIELVGDRMAALFTLVGIPSGTGGQADYTGIVNNGTVMVQAGTFSGSALSLAQELARAEQGLLWVQASGNLTFRDRYHIIDRTEFNTSQITLDEAAEIMATPIQGSITGFERRVVAVAASGATGKVVKYDSGAATNNPGGTDHLAGMDVLYDADVEMLATAVQKRRETAVTVTKPQSVDLWVTGPGSTNATVLTGLVDQTIDMFNAVTLTYRPEGWSSDETYVARVMGIRHAADVNGLWRVTLDLGPHSTTWQTASANFYEFAATLAGTDRLAL